MKAVRLQIDIMYHCPDELVDELYSRDKDFFNNMAEAFSYWEVDPEEPRIPINFDFRHATGEVSELETNITE